MLQSPWMSLSVPSWKLRPAVVFSRTVTRWPVTKRAPKVEPAYRMECERMRESAPITSGRPSASGLG